MKTPKQRLGCSALVAVWFLSACALEPPPLPNEDTLFLPGFQVGQPSEALTADLEETTNVTAAATSMGWVSLTIDSALTTPQMIFAGVVQQEPRQDSDEWIWRRAFPLLGGEAELRVTEDGGVVSMEMHVTGERDDIQHIDDFVWVTGTHQEKSGQWEIFDPGTPDVPGPDHPAVRIDWERESADDKLLTFTNVSGGDPKENDFLKYGLLGQVASMAVHDEKSGENDDGDPADFVVIWHIENGAGIMSTATEDFCWDTLDNDQVDISCPAGGWPRP